MKTNFNKNLKLIQSSTQTVPIKKKNEKNEKINHHLCIYTINGIKKRKNKKINYNLYIYTIMVNCATVNKRI